VNLSLEQNAADSLNRSVAYFAENTPSGLKAAVKELVSAMELYVKAQLARLDVDPSNPVLVYERFKIEIADDPPRRHVLTPAGVNTVRFDDALKRLEWLGHEVATADAAQIRELKKARNALEHYAVALEADTVRSLYVAVVGFATRYLHAYLDISFLDVVDNGAWRRALDVEPALRSVAELTAKQVFEGLILATDQVEGVSDCASCGAQLLIESGGGYYPGYRCVVCGFVHDVESCYRCHKTFTVDAMHPNEGDAFLCDACHQAEHVRS
jgi:hypothetical protein